MLRHTCITQARQAFAHTRSTRTLLLAHRSISSTSASRFTVAQSAKMPADASKSASKDPYTENTEKQASPQEKVKEIQTIIQEAKVCMLTTRAKDGALHSRAMAPASKTAPFAFEFIANSESGKFDEVDSHSEVNVSFYDQSSTDWISVAGNAHASSDKARIKEIFNPMVSAWFGDLGDGVHDGTATDPRVELIVVEPTEIRYWKKTQTNLGQLANVVVSAATGKTANPGYLRTITKDELAQAKSA